uniref:hypothetical protein n=1 Tax=Escherichia coli TaxID=562 RepID=UPI0005C70DE2
MTGVEIAGILKDYGPWGLCAILMLVIEYKMRGAFCVFRTIAGGFLSWRLSRMQDRYAELCGQIATIAESGKAAIAADTGATERMQSAQAVAAEALREQGQE